MTKPLWAPWRLAYVTQAGEQVGCVFCEEADGSLGGESLAVYRSEHVVVLLNKFPYSSGHLMVAPVRHVAELGQLDANEANAVHEQTVRAIDVLRAIYRPDAFNVGWNLGAIAGGSITGHLHEHVVPRWSGDTNFMPVLADVKVLPEHLLETRDRLREGFGG